MSLESEYLKAKKITDYYESKLLEKNNINNLESLFFELRKRTNKVEVERLEQSYLLTLVSNIQDTLLLAC